MSVYDHHVVKGSRLELEQLPSSLSLVASIYSFIPPNQYEN